jgi:predicted membrane chloride channel (bestrophin family)
MSLAFGSVFNLGYYVIPGCDFLLLGIGLFRTKEIEDPFGKDANDLQKTIAKTVTRHIEELL